MSIKKIPLRKLGKSDASKDKQEIQRLVREIVMIRDKGCVFRHFPESGACGGYRGDGEFILQFDHLHSRVNSVSFGDERLGVCVCKRHHIFWKRQYPAKYEELVRKVIGKERCELLDRVREDHKSYRIDWKLIILGLKKKLQNLT